MQLIRLGSPAAAFASGMSRVLPLAALRLFSPAEFNQLLSGGTEGGLDMEDLRGGCGSERVEAWDACRERGT